MVVSAIGDVATPPWTQTIMITIALAEDHEIVREGFRAILDAEPDFKVVGEVKGGQEAVTLVESLDPDVLIVDLMLPGLHGLEVTWQVTRRFPRTRVVILSMHASEPYVVQAFRNGASAYVLKGSASADLKKAVREVVEGRRYLAPPLSDRAVEAFVSGSAEPEQESFGALTHREREVLQLAAEGRTSKEIATRLHISPRTVEKHRSNLMSKLDVHNTVELVRYAVSQGVIPPPPVNVGATPSPDD
jgi:DNA-binding NarL/FixJ family response regulator